MGQDGNAFGWDTNIDTGAQHMANSDEPSKDGQAQESLSRTT